METCKSCGSEVNEREIANRAIAGESFAVEVNCFVCSAQLKQVEEVSNLVKRRI